MQTNPSEYSSPAQDPTTASRAPAACAPLDILIVEDEVGVAATLAQLLSSRAHRVTVKPTAEDALGIRGQDVLIVDVGLKGMDGLQLLAEYRSLGETPRAVVISGNPSPETIQRAMRMGAVDFLVKPIPINDLYAAVEGPSNPKTEQVSRFKQAYPVCSDSCNSAPRDLAAYALRCGVNPSARARIAGAVAEAVENCFKHSGLDRNDSLVVEATLSPSRMTVHVRDNGVGCSRSEFSTKRDPGSVPSGIIRMTALSDSIRTTSEPGAGTTVEMTFCITQSTFDEGGCLDLTELDWLSPAVSRMVLAEIGRSDLGTTFSLSPALTAAVGRLLSRSSSESRTTQD